MAGKSRVISSQKATSRHRLRFETLEDRSLPSFVTAPTFTVGVNIGGLVPQGSKPVAVAVGDFNDDGKTDVVTANESRTGVSLRPLAPGPANSWQAVILRSGQHRPESSPRM